MEQVFFDWKYCYDKGVYNIIPDREIEKPKTFYKYYGLTNNSIDAITNTYIYATHPYQLNDIIDCSELFFEFDDIQYIRATLNAHPYFAGQTDEELLTPKNKKYAQHAFTADLYKYLGILSLTNDPHNDLMWAYYTNNCGICVEYDVSQFEFKHHGPFPINYQQKIYSIPTSTIKDPHLAILMQSNVKKSIWAHEEEWRLLVEADKHDNLRIFGIPEYKQLEGHDRKFQYPISAIKSIILGMSFFYFNERLSSIEEIFKLQQCKFKLKDDPLKELKQTLLDFICYHQIRIDYTFVTGLNEITYVPMILKKCNNSDYIGTIL